MVAHQHVAVEHLDRVAQVDAPRRHGEVRVRDDDTEQQQRVGALDPLADRGIAGQAEVGADQRHVGMREQAAAHEAGDHRDAQPPCQLGHALLDAIAAHLDADHQHRPLGGGQPRQQLVGAGRQPFGIGRDRRRVGHRVAGRARHVARDLQVHRPRARERGVEHARHQRRRALRIVEPRAVDRQFLEQPPLRIERLHLVVQQEAAGRFVRGRRAGQHDQRHAFGIGAGHGIDQVERAGTIGDGGHAEAAAGARCGIGGEADARLVRQRVQRQQLRVFDLAEQRQREVARDAEDLARAARLQCLQQASGEVHAFTAV